MQRRHAFLCTNLLSSVVGWVDARFFPRERTHVAVCEQEEEEDDDGDDDDDDEKIMMTFD
jgi:hypothetical protein